MKFQLNKLMAGLVMAGSAVALVGCGGGDAPDLLPKNIAATIVPTDTAAVALARNVTTALASSAPITLTSAAATNMGVPSGSKMTFGSTVPAGAIASATITSGSRSLNTTVTAGSCVFTVTGPADESLRIINTSVTPNRAYKIDDPETTNVNEAETITVSPCAITAEVSDLVAGADPVTRTVSITLGTGGTVESSATFQKTTTGSIVINEKEVAKVSATGGISVN